MPKKVAAAGIVAATLFSVPVVTAEGAQAAGNGPSVTLATYNICKWQCGSGKFAWSKRIKAVVRNIAASGADVVGVQEAAGTALQMASGLNKHGYALANSHTDRCDGVCTLDSFVFYKTSTIEPVVLRQASDPIPSQCAPYANDAEPPFNEPPDLTLEEPEYPSLSPSDPGYEQAWADYRARKDAYDRAYAAWEQQWDAYYDAEAAWWDAYDTNDCYRYEAWKPFTDVSEGTNTLSAVSKSRWPAAIMDRGWSYAYLRHKKTKSSFLAVSLHLPNEKTPEGERVRRASARGVLAALKAQKAKRGVSGVPTLVATDLNSFQRRQPRGAQHVFRKAGFTDAYTARRRKNADAATVNVTPAFPNPFPRKPFRSSDPARIDYVMSNKGRAIKYEVFLKLKNGNFDNRYRGSDHNLVAGTFKLPKYEIK